MSPLARLYYSIKPFVPWSVRMGLRRLHARRLKRKSSAVWPIVESAGRKPRDWKGWPNGANFAFVLTHDVESEAGVATVRHLAELEMSLGLRSSFNFIPEGPYRVPAELRDWLVGNGFEVGVHDLYHDGSLYRSRKGFLLQAARINRYLAEWNAIGFRAGFMLRNLDWLQELNVLYDASTFDTDPFEPQPDGAGTIFPFWVPKGSALNLASNSRSTFRSSAFDSSSSEDLPSSAGRAGYVELPYTLPQDFTLFGVLRHKTGRVWDDKLKWIVERGGMALINVHPDYVAFDGKPSTGGIYTSDLYRSFLVRVTREFAGCFWHALPNAVATHVVSRSVDAVSLRDLRDETLI